MSRAEPVDVLAVMETVGRCLLGLDMAPFVKELHIERNAKARAAVADLIASQEKSREVLRAIVRDKKGGVHLSAALAACHQANAALAAISGEVCND